MTVTQFSGLDQTTIGQFDATDIAALSDNGLIGFTNMNLLSPTQVGEIPVALFSDITSTQIGMLPSLTTTTLSGLTFTQLSALPSGALDGLSETQIAALAANS